MGDFIVIDIAVGDFVQVVRAAPCCGGDTEIGLVFQVVEITAYKDSECDECGSLTDEILVWSSKDSGFEFSRLKKLPSINNTNDDEFIEEIQA